MLADGNPAIEIIEAKNGAPTIKVADEQGKMLFLHSSYNPQAEGEKSVAGFEPAEDNIIVVFGFGLGYHIEALLKKIGPKSRVFIIEGRQDIYEQALKLRDFSQLLTDNRLTIVVGNDLQIVSKQFSQTFNITREAGIVFFEHATSVRLTPGFYQQAASALRDVVSLQLSSVATLINFKDKWIQNNLVNLKEFLSNPGVLNLFDKFRDVPAVIISAGPSLNKNIEQLAEAKGKALLICVGTALKAVLKANIKPDLVVTYDAGEMNLRHFEGLDIIDIPLAFDPMVHPDIVSQHKGQKFVLSVGNTITCWLEGLTGSKGYVEAGGSVATLALSLAINMGCNPVALVGQDLSFPEGKTHARGTVYENITVAKNDDDLHYLYVPANNGGEVLTNRAYYSFLVWFEQYIKNLSPEKTVINATEGGARIEGAKLMTLREFIAKFSARDISELTEKLKQDYETKQNITPLVRELEKAADSLRIIAKKCARGANLAGDLYKCYMNNRIHGEREILEELNKIDRILKSKQEDVYFINEALQEVLISVTRGSLAKANPGGETAKEKNMRSAILSKALYEGINESVTKLYEFFINALKLVRSDYKLE